MEKNIKQKIEKITNIINNNRVVDIEIATEPQMRKTNNPYLGRVKKHTAYLGVDCGESYTAEVNRRRMDEGKEGDFQAKASIYERVNDYFVRRGEQAYLQMLLKQKHETKKIYEVDGRPATTTEVAEIESFLHGSGKSSKQGLGEGNEVQVRVVKIENVVALGGATWHIEL